MGGRLIKSSRILVIATAVIAILAQTPALAAGGGGSGGGGGSSGPSASGSRADPAKRYSQGLEFLKAQNYKQAEKAFDDVLDAAGKDANANFMMALAQIG